MRTAPIFILAPMLLAFFLSAQGGDEKLLSDENAYNPIPSPDGKLIAYVRTGWERTRGTGGFGRSNLRSEVAVTTTTGDIVSQTPVADAFLFNWTPDGNGLICYRDGHFLLVSPHGGVIRQTDETGSQDTFSSSERVAYLSKSNTFVWVEHARSPRTVLLTERGRIAGSSGTTGAIVVPSPNERFIAIVGNDMDLWIYDTTERRWADLGKANIHPDASWDYIKPSWNPWFADSSRLVFISGSSVVVASPDGRHRAVVLHLATPSGLAVPSPDGKRLAYVTFAPGPKKDRPDLTFWGGSAVWTVSTDGNGNPQQVSSPNDDTTYDLNWLGNDRIVFDRISDTPFYSHARLWIASVP
jgi:Tol biopolymer transport system component